MNKYIYISLFLFLFSCKNDEPIAKKPLGYEYTGLNIGSMRKYEVKVINYDIQSLKYITDSLHITYTAGVDTLISYVKDSIVEKIIDLEGDTSFVFYRYYSTDKSKFLSYPDSVWTGKLKRNQYISTENNIKYIKLVFPPSKSKKWDKNALNTKKNNEVHYTNIRVPKKINDLYFLNCVEVEHNNEYDSTLLPTILHKYQNVGYLAEVKIENEIYAENVGLISKIDIFLENSYNESLGKYINDDFFVIASGKQYFQKLIDYK